METENDGKELILKNTKTCLPNETFGFLGLKVIIFVNNSIFVKRRDVLLKDKNLFLKISRIEQLHRVKVEQHFIFVTKSE